MRNMPGSRHFMGRALLIPDIVFENGINVVMSVAISDPARFEQDVMNAPDMEAALRKHQRKYNVGAYEAG